MIYIGIDCGATTSKVCGIDADGTPLSATLRQRPTRSEDGPGAIIGGWMEGVVDFLAAVTTDWNDVGGVGLAIPGPYLDYGVLGRMPNMDPALEGWHFLDDLRRAVEVKAGREIPVVTANDGLLAGVAEADFIQSREPGGVLMLTPGSGLGCSFVDSEGRPLQGDHQAGVIVGHMPAPFARLGLPTFRCGCGRDWGCHEAYTSISGLPQYLEHFFPQYPNHPLANDRRTLRERGLSLRGLAQQGDALALAIFDTQARALGLTVAASAMAYDPSHVVIGGGLMDPESTTAEFRRRYLDGIRRSAEDYLWIEPERITYHEARLGELSQAIGAALLAKRSESTSSNRC